MRCSAADDPVAYYLETVGCDRVTAEAVAAAAAVPAAAERDVATPPVAEQVAAASPAGMDIEAQWDALALQVAGCTACDLAAGRTRTVFGSGDRAADLLLIGEAPGHDEDQQGEPFVGRAGRLLNQMLAAIGLTRQQVLVINVIKCRPPRNRDPKPQEIAACRHFIDAQIAMVRPKVIGLLGRVASCAMLERDAPLSVLRHHWHEVRGIPAYVTYHPAFLLRSPQQKVEGWRDMLQIKARLAAAGGD